MVRIRFAVAFDGRFLEQWHLDCLDRLGHVADLVGVIITQNGTSDVPKGTASGALRRYAQRLDARVRVDVTDRFADIARVDAEHPHTLDDLPALDFVLKLGRDPMPARAPETRFGVWYFPHELGAALLPLFREVYAAEDVTYAALAVFRPGATDTAILEAGYFPTNKHSYLVNRERVLARAAGWPARTCERLLSGAGLETKACPPSLPKPEQRASLLRFRAALAGRRLALAWERLFRHPQWNIGVLDAPVGSLLLDGAFADARIEWFPLDHRRSFLADPFGVSRNGTLDVVCESFDYRESRGHISALTHTAAGFTPEEPALTLPVHASYPLLLEHLGAMYCVPETSDANEVALFRADEFPRRWSKVGVLVDGFAGVDPTVFLHGDRWWLLCTEKGAYEDVELWVWHAPDLLGPWTPHIRNPVKADVRGARPGGPPFVHGGTLYRPAQDCSRTYGGRIAIQRVTRLTPTDFAEEPVAVLEASGRSPFPIGPHTIAAVGDGVLVDGRRTVFVWLAFRAFLRIWRRNLARRLSTGLGGPRSP